ncbi:MAG: hypothetical protein ACR2MC_12015 [Actinomycetota bacterium]
MTITEVQNTLRRWSATRETPGANVTGRWDIAFVAGAVIVSFVLYLWGLGFYSDDWAFLGSLHIFGDHSMVGRSELIDWAMYFRQRPVQIPFQQLLFWAFGLNPLGYHLTNSLLLTAMAVMMHLVLRQLAIWRPLALALPVIFALLPHYSTDRYWFAAFGYVLSMALFFLSVYADLRGARSVSNPLKWKLLALIALLASALNYEVAIPLFLLSTPLIALRYRTLPDGPGRAGWAWRNRSWLIVGNVVAIAGVVIFKAIVTAGAPETPDDLLLHVARLGIGSIAINFGSLGIGLPQAVLWAAREASPTILIVGALLAVTVALYMWMVIMRTPEPFPTSAFWGSIILAGFVVFVASYAIFIPTERILFTSTGIANRVGIAGAVGVAFVFVGVLGWLCRVVLPPGGWRASGFAAGVSGLALAGFLLVNVQGAQWGQAWSEQRAVLGEVREDLQAPEPETVVIIDGVCPYVGGAIVFESNWDVTGALQVTFGDPTLMGDVASANLTIGEDGLSTVLYGSLEAHYRFGPHLFLLDSRSAALAPIPDEDVARRVLNVDASKESACTRGAAGYGTTILPLDQRYRRLEDRFLWSGG